MKLNPTSNYLDVGQALREVREHRLYRDLGHANFRAYCHARLWIGFSYAHRLIAAAKVVEILKEREPTEELVNV